MDTATDGVTRTRRQFLGVLCGVLAAGCAARDGGGEATAAETASRSTQSPSNTRTPTDTPVSTDTPTPQETIVLETRIELLPVDLSEAERGQVEPLSVESLPAEERRIVAEAADGGFSVSYGRYEYPTDGGRTAGLSSLVDRVLGRLDHQLRVYEIENPTATAANPPSHVSAVYVRYEGRLYCLDVVDGDQKYYHCPE